MRPLSSVRALGLWPRCLVAAVIVLAGCERNTTSSDPMSTELRGRAVALEVDLDSFTVRQASASDLASLSSGANGPRFALLGHNEVTTTVTNVTQTSLSSPHRVRIKFDLALTNNLSSADLVPATFPEPPTQQVVAFPFSTEPSGWFGLRVRATSDWNGTGAPGSGAPWNFFNNDNHCWGSTPPSDCYRWEAFGSVIPAGGTSAPHTVSFDVSPDVKHFRVYVVVAADIHERPLPAGTGGIAGTVTSPERGALAGVTVSGGGHSTSTAATGLFVLSGLTPGSVALSLSGLPDGCTAPATSVTVAAGEVATATISVSCPSAGAVEGQVRANGAGLQGVQVQVNGTTFSATTGGEGGFHIDGVPAGARQIALGNLPAGCTNPGFQAITVVAGGVAHAVFDVTCPTAAPERIAVTSLQTGNAELYVLNVDGSNPTRLTFTTDESEMQPAWSPDAQRIVFTRRSGSGATAQERLLVINADGTNEQPLTDVMTAARNASYSPDGAKIAFTCTIPGEFANQLCVVNADGSGLHLVTDQDGFDFVALSPDWDPSGDRIAFVPSLGNPDGTISYVQQSGTSAGGVTTGLEFTAAPAFSQDGSQLAFTLLTTDGDIYVVSSAGGTPVNITNGAGAKNSPTWTRDGSSIVYENGGDLYRVSATGGTPTQITSGGMYLTPHIR